MWNNGWGYRMRVNPGAGALYQGRREFSPKPENRRQNRERLTGKVKRRPAEIICGAAMYRKHDSALECQAGTGTDSSRGRGCSGQNVPSKKPHRHSMGLCRWGSPNPKYQIEPCDGQATPVYHEPDCLRLYLQGHRFDDGFSGRSRTDPARVCMPMYFARNHVMRK